jgi:hypothetical protein
MIIQLLSSAVLMGISIMLFVIVAKMKKESRETQTKN